jgi:transposase-like protein
VVEETLEAGASVARVALKHGSTRTRCFSGGACIAMASWEAPQSAMKLLPVSVAEDESLPKAEPVEVVPAELRRDSYRAAGRDPDQPRRQRRSGDRACVLKSLRS